MEDRFIIYRTSVRMKSEFSPKFNLKILKKLLCIWRHVVEIRFGTVDVKWTPNQFQAVLLAMVNKIGAGAVQIVQNKQNKV